MQRCFHWKGRGEIGIWDKKKYVNIRRTKEKEKQRSTKHTHKTKDWVTRTPLKSGVEIRCSGMVRSSCTTSGTRHVNFVTNPVISHGWGKYREVCSTSGTYGHLWYRYSITVNKVMEATVNLSKLWLQLSQEEPWVQ